MLPQVNTEDPFCFWAYSKQSEIEMMHNRWLTAYVRSQTFIQKHKGFSMWVPQVWTIPRTGNSLYYQLGYKILMKWLRFPAHSPLMYCNLTLSCWPWSRQACQDKTLYVPWAWPCCSLQLMKIFECSIYITVPLVFNSFFFSFCVPFFIYFLADSLLAGL